MKKLIFILLVVNTACVSILDIDLPKSQEVPVLVSLLHPDSTLKVRISKTIPYDSQNGFVEISSAKVVITEDGINRYTLKYVGNGTYESNYKPKENSIYSIEAKIDENITLSAKDTIPKLILPEIEITQSNPKNPNNNPDIFIKKKTNLMINWWISLLFYRNNPTRISVQNIQSNSPYFDFFNSRIDNLTGLRSYYYINRVVPNAPIDTPIKISFINAYREANFVYIDVINTSKQYDKYLKSAIITFQGNLIDASGDIKNPFGEFLTTYSNVNNGIGVFVASNSKRISLK
jgi:hypothetical protein